MEKTLVEDEEEHTRVPFLRGILTRSLQNTGLSFDTAYELATEIRGQLTGVSLITSEELRSKVLDLLRTQADEYIATRYAEKQLPLVIQVEQRDGQITAFSRLEYQHQLESIGLTNEEAMSVVARIHKHLVDRRTETITSSYLDALTYRYLRQSSELGPAVAHRWLVWRDFVHSGRPLIFLIGGAPGSGKSTVATMLASYMDIVRTQSTDMLREVMRIMSPKQLMPVLHTSSFTAWTALPTQPGDETPETLLIRGYQSQADLIAVAIEAVIQRGLQERVSLILEGVHIHPAMIATLPDHDDAFVVPIMLGVLKRKQLQRRIRGRGHDVPQRRSERYLEHFDEIWGLQSFLLSEADRTEVPIVVNDDRDRTFREIMRITIDSLAVGFDRTPKEVFG